MKPVGVNDEGGGNLLRLAALNDFAGKIYAANPLNQSISMIDLTNPEIIAFLQKLHDNQVKYMLVGGVATTFHGYVRTTQDLDLWVKGDRENKERLVRTLHPDAIPFRGIVSLRTKEGYHRQKSDGIRLLRLGFVADLMEPMKGFSKNDFDKCYARAKKGLFEGVPITVLHLNDLIFEKKMSGRDKDKDDVINLENIRDSKERKP